MRERLVMREQLKFEAGGRLCGISVVGDQVAPAYFERVHADFGGGELDQPFRHRHRDRVTDRAVLAHDIFILEHNACLRAVVWAFIGPAREVDDLIGLDTAGARINRIGTDAGQIVDFKSGDSAILADADLRFDAMIARVDVGHETFDTVGHEFDGTLEQLGQCDRRHFVGIGVHLDAEGAADVFRLYAHLVGGNAEMLGKQVLHHMRCLRTLIDRHALLAFVPVGDDRTRLVGDTGVASKNKCGFDHRVGFRKGFVDGAHLQLALKAEIVAKRGVNDRRFAIESRFRIGDGRQFLVTHVHQFTSVLSLRARARNHGANGLALPARAVDRDRRLRRRFEALQMREHADPRRHDLCKLGAGHDRNDPRRLFRGLGGDPGNACMRVRGTHVRNMSHARQGYVADILPATLRQPLQIRSWHRAPDV